MGWDKVRNATEGTSEGLDYIKFKEGTTQIRIIGEPVVRWRHWIKALNRGYFCTGKGCPVCEMNKRHKADTGANLHATSRRYSVLVIDREDGAVKIMDGSQTLFDNLLVYLDEIGDLTTFDVKIHRKGSGLDTTWGIIPQAIAPLSEEDEKMVELDFVDLEEYLTVPTREQWLELLDGKDPSDVFQNTDNEEVEEKEEVEEEEVDFSIES